MARDNPEALITEPVDIEQGMTDEISMRVVKAIGFEGKQAEQVSTRVWVLPEEIYFYLLLTFCKGSLFRAVLYFTACVSHKNEKQRVFEDMFIS